MDFYLNFKHLLFWVFWDYVYDLIFDLYCSAGFNIHEPINFQIKLITSVDINLHLNETYCVNFVIVIVFIAIVIKDLDSISIAIKPLGPFILRQI